MWRRSLTGLVLSVLCACEPYDSPPSSEIFQPCCGALGTCIPEGLVPDGLRMQLAQDVCGSALLCAPSNVAENPSYVAASCRATGNLEGRCLPGCLPALANSGQMLEQSTCAPGELCAPCHDPRTGEETLACRIGGDPGPAEPARTFGSCCDGRARCVPTSFAERVASADDRMRLSAGSCTEPTDTCVPTEWLDGAPAPARCRALGNLEGRCVLDCIPDVARRKASLARDSCEAGELCAPCFDPLTGEDTEICRQGSDLPVEAARSFGPCCDARGRCVPREVLATQASEADASRLSRDVCAAAAELCVPQAWLESERRAPTSCQAAGALEGRCLPTCLPDVAKRAAQLDVSTCAVGELCVPCFDPRTGQDTEACRTGTDQPTRPAQRYAACCGTEGLCVPESLLAKSASEEQISLLGQDSCQDAQAACVPKRWLDEPDVAPVTCRAFENFEGRCLSTCLPAVAKDADTLSRDVCSASERCVPCFDPRTGEDTDACRTGTDQPTETPAELASCCGGSGRCVPGPVLSESLREEEQSALGQDTCASADARCVPASWLAQGTAVALQTCRSPGDLEGRCVSQCVPRVAEQAARLTRGACGDLELCVPCFDPQTLESTEVCTFGADQPREPARTFGACCGGSGVCVPVEYLAEDQRTLPRDTCTGYDARCVPKPLFAQPPGALDGCDTNLSGPGICMQQCFLAGQSALLTAALATCETGGLCVPCTAVPIEGVGCE